MRVRTDHCGNLVMQADSNDIYVIVNRFQPLQAEDSEQRFIRSRLAVLYKDASKEPLRLHPIKPEECGALTSAPLLTDGKSVWGFMDYQVKSFLEELAEGREIVWVKG